MTTEDDVRRICLALPETAERPYERSPSFRVKGKMFARIRQKPYALMVGRHSIEEKMAFLTAEPEKYFQTPHYEGHPAMLVHLEAISLDELKGLLVDGWLMNAPVRVRAKVSDREELLAMLGE